ncbi:MAG: ABC transporter ATP-binding protein [Pirellulales bacterium]|nr:ABC transporter ATP-binding protein [Pirellulales bacterium]
MTPHENADREAVIQTQDLSRHFGDVTALDNVTLTVPRGSVFGLVGVNGAGKTTLIRHVLGLLKAQAGSIRVFGLDPVAEPVRVLARIGYLAEENDLPDWMRVGELLRYTRAFYPTWDESYAEALRRTFELDLNAKVRHLSKGQRARTGLLLALAHCPEVLVLDEPSSGLDPIVRRDILAAIIRTISDEGRTVLFSSHLLDEVERVSDHVAMIHDGRIVLCDRTEAIKDSHREATIRFDEPRGEPPSIPGALAWSGAAHEWTAVHRGSPDELHAATARAGGRWVHQRALSLDEIFVAHVGAENLVSAEA